MVPTNLHIQARSALLAVLIIGLLLAAPLAGSQPRAQITTWSNADSSFFPVERITRIDRSNTPGRFDSQRVANRIPQGQHTLAYAAVDLTTAGAYLVEDMRVMVCPPR